MKFAVRIVSLACSSGCALVFANQFNVNVCKERLRMTVLSEAHSNIYRMEVLIEFESRLIQTFSKSHFTSELKIISKVFNT